MQNNFIFNKMIYKKPYIKNRITTQYLKFINNETCNKPNMAQNNFKKKIICFFIISMEKFY